MELTSGTIIAGKFRLDHPLAQGGMGSVWVAFNTQLEVPVALKFMAPALVGSAELVARFEREAKAAAQLRNPHVVQVFEHGLDRGTPFIAMELLEGEDLGNRLRAQGRLSLHETSRIVGDVCKALRRAHDMGLVHRDLKPANIFLCKHDEYEVVKVLDFGIAKSVAASSQDEATKTGALVGSPHYMSPEQARRTNRQVDHRADLWAVGVITFRCLTGRLPFPGDDVIDVLVRVCTEAVPVASSIAGDLGPEVDRFLARAMAREPDQRFQSAREMAEALAKLAGPTSRESLHTLDRSWSDVRPPPARVELNVPPPRAAALGAAHGGPPPPPPPDPASVTDVFDNAATLPLAHPSAQRALAGHAWAAALPPASVAGDVPAMPVATTAPLPGIALSPAPAAIPPRDAGRAPSGSAPQAFTPAAMATLAASHTTTDPTLLPQAGGTLTSAGTELMATPATTSAGQGRSWIAPVAAVAALVVVGILVGSVMLARGAGEASAEGPTDGSTSATAGAAAAGDGTTAATATAATATAAPSAAAEVSPGATTGETGTDSAPVMPSSTAAPSTAPSAKAVAPPSTSKPVAAPGTATGKAGAKPSKPPSSFLDAQPRF